MTSEETAKVERAPGEEDPGLLKKAWRSGPAGWSVAGAGATFSAAGFLNGDESSSVDPVLVAKELVASLATQAEATLIAALLIACAFFIVRDTRRDKAQTERDDRKDREHATALRTLREKLQDECEKRVDTMRSDFAGRYGELYDRYEAMADENNKLTKKAIKHLAVANARAGLSSDSTEDFGD